MTDADECRPGGPAVFESPQELLTAVGRELGPTPGVLVDQARIDMFADATGDHQWIHVDRERAALGPYASTVAHGYLTLGLAGTFVPELIVVVSASSVINYGIDRLRFLSPVRAGSVLCGHAVIAAASPVRGGVQVALDLTVDIVGADRPACVARNLLRYLD